MKYTILISLLSAILFTSCLKKNTEAITGFNDNNINDVAGVWFRFLAKVIDKTSKNVTIKVTPTKNILNSIPEKVRGDLKLSNIAVVLAIPTGAKITPVGNAPKLGVSGDWTKANRYIVQAANGAEAEWTILFSELNL